MASSTKTGVDLNLSQEARDKIAAKAKAALEAKEQRRRERRSRKGQQRLDLKLPLKDGIECKLGYKEKATCLASDKPYAGRDKCTVCDRGGKL